VLEAVVHPISDRPVVVQAGEHFVDLARHVFQAAHVEEGLLLAGERGVGQVFGGGRGANRHFDIVAEALAHLGPGIANRVAEGLGQGCFDDPAADFLAGCRQFAHILDIQRFQSGPNLFVQPGFGQEIAESIGRGGKSAGHVHAHGRQICDHFAK